MSDDRLEELEDRVSAQFSLLIAVFKMMLCKGLVTPEELEVTFNGISTTLQEHALRAPDLPDETRRSIDAHLAEIGKLRHHLEV